MDALESCSRCCAPYSFAGGIFLFVIGMALVNEYKYIEVDETQMSKVDAGYVCIWAAAIYVILFIASVGFIMYRKNSASGH